MKLSIRAIAVPLSVAAALVPAAANAENLDEVDSQVYTTTGTHQEIMARAATCVAQLMKPGRPGMPLILSHDDAAGVTAAFNRNVLERINHDLAANFRPECFDHRARWNAQESRIEMHLVARHDQAVHLPANSAGDKLTIRFVEGESIHTENSYKFTDARVGELLLSSGFALTQTWKDAAELFAVNLATAV